MWVAAFELAGDMPQLVFQVHNDNLTVSFLRRKDLKFTIHLLCARSSLDFHFASLSILVKEYQAYLINKLKFKAEG